MGFWRNDIVNINVAGSEYSAIIIGPEENNIPRHLLQLERKDGYIIDGENMAPFKWRGVTKDDKFQYVYFDKCNLEPIYSLATKYRDEALSFVLQISYGLSKCNDSFLNLESGVFPLYRIYILDGKKIVLLPPDMGDMIAIARMGERRDAEANHLVKRDTEPSYKLILEMGELLYYAATGILPYQNADVRTCHYNEVPLAWYDDTLNKETMELINSVLHMKERTMRDIGGNRKPQDNLGWFIKGFLDKEWNLKAQSEEERAERIKKTENLDKYKAFFNKIGKEAHKRNFWRIKGTLIITIAAISIVLGILFGTIAYEHFKAPFTKGMNQIEFIESFYSMQDSLNSAELDTAIKADIPQATEVLNLFVSKQAITAYETFNPHVRASEWVESGKPDVMSDAFIYGVDLHSVEQIDDDTFRAKTTWYTPYEYDSNEEDYYIPPEGNIAVYSYDVWQDFTFEWNRRGWWTVVDIELPQYEFIEMELVGTYEKPSLAF